MKKIMSFIIPVLIGVILCYLLVENYLKLEIIKETAKNPTIVLTKITIYTVILGILLESHKFILLIKGHIRISWMVVPSVVLLFVLCIPTNQWVIWFNGLGDFPINLFTIPQPRTFLSILVGVLLVRSLCDSRS
ncbi:hypothetical protein D7Z54_33500 [Salibacterium salarium]|uniref:Uncharacterized protein n=1 Tax=Salibacterium salarium TaxID=284579 RepID=A0A3R9R7Q8_9BACI|nr:hypothetical protein [Salibacterium salarium]RSL29014.1 hypothetical protein D7Z54_33500 [Salibacterium salarium]